MHGPTLFKTSLFLCRKQDLLLSTVILRMVRSDSCICFLMLNVEKFQIPSSLNKTGSGQLGLCSPSPPPHPLAKNLHLTLHPNYVQNKGAFPNPRFIYS
jgi:hypothetical protein